MGEAVLRARVRLQVAFFTLARFLALFLGLVLVIAAVMTFLLVRHLVLLREEVAEVDALLVLQLVLRSFLFSFPVHVRIFVVALEVEPGVNIVRGCFCAAGRVHHLCVRLQLVLTLESHVAFILAICVRAQKVRLVEVLLQTWVV